MILAELLAMMGILGASGVGVATLLTWAKKSTIGQHEKEARALRMQDDLRNALASRDHGQLDDWLVVYDDSITDGVRRHVEARRDELYIEKNS